MGKSMRKETEFLILCTAAFLLRCVIGGRPVTLWGSNRLEDNNLLLQMNSKGIKRHLSSPRFGNSLVSPSQDTPRRSSIQENFTHLSKTLSSLRLTPSKSSGEGWNLFGVLIDKEVLEFILSKHYEDTSIKVK